MSKQLRVSQLKTAGFKLVGSGNLEDGGWYDWYALTFNSIKLECTIEYNQAGKKTKQYYEIGDEVLKGREITLKDIELLKEIL